jgi:integrase
MPHFPKPWFRPSRNTWYVEIDGTQHSLGAHEGAPPKKGRQGWSPPEAVDDAFRELKKALKEAKPEPAVAVKPDLVSALCDKFLDWVEKHRSADTYRWYLDRIQAFIDFKTDEYVVRELTVARLRPLHVQEWVDGMDVKSGTRRNYVRAVKRALAWAEEQGHVQRSPLCHMKKPAGGRRDNVISPATHALILKHTRDLNFRDLCDFCYQTGARCAEALAVEARHLDLKNHRVVFPPDEEKMERVPRIIYLGDAAEAVLSRLAKEHPAGKLFRNTDGLPWHPDATNLRFRTLKKKLGTKYCLTDYRHSFTQRLLEAGVDAVTVAALLGHSNTNMVMSTYSHMSHAVSYLREAALKAT